jgi:hypothetical protein
MIAFNQFLREQYELAEPNFNTIEDFLQSITTDPKTGKPMTLKQFADKVSWLSLYTMNKHGIGSSGVGRDEKLSKLIQTLSLFFHQNIMWPITSPLRDKMNELHAHPEFNKKRITLFKQKMVARREGDISLLKQIESELADLQNPNRSAIDKFSAQIDAATEQAKNTLITPEYFSPQTEEAGQTYQHVYKDFEDLKN